MINNYDLTNSPLDVELLRRYKVIPLENKHNTFCIGIADVDDQQTIKEIAFHTGLTIKPILVTAEQINVFLDLHCNAQTVNKFTQMNLLKQIALDDNLYGIQELAVNYDEPLVKFVDSMIQNAIDISASDIHIEPYEKTCRIRYRQHGILHEVMDIPPQLALRVTTRLKVMAKLDIAERRLPQDGRLQQDDTDIRINTCPTLHGEKIVLRLLNSHKLSLAIDQLGMSDSQQTIFLNKINKPQGMILVTGPTGSGKTVTLYSALAHLNRTEKNISTVEDPVEIRITGINQVNIHNKIGLTYASVLRTFLRQDPDIIMVGEMRDKETADIAIQAAQTGHLVLSTLHTNNTLETITRLKSMGVIPFYLAYSISLIIAQRLIRILCEHCKTYHAKTESYQAQGCSLCIGGYTKRTAIYEFLPIDENIIDSILGDTPLKQNNFVSLYAIGLEKVKQGITVMRNSHGYYNAIKKSHIPLAWH